MLGDVDDEVVELWLQLPDEHGSEEPVPDLLEAEDVDVRNDVADGALQLDLKWFVGSF